MAAATLNSSLQTLNFSESALMALTDSLIQTCPVKAKQGQTRYEKKFSSDPEVHDSS